MYLSLSLAAASQGKWSSVQMVYASARYGDVDVHLPASRRRCMERLAAGTLLLERWSASRRSSGPMTNSALHAALCIMGCVTS